MRLLSAIKVIMYFKCWFSNVCPFLSYHLITTTPQPLQRKFSGTPLCLTHLTRRPSLHLTKFPLSTKSLISVMFENTTTFKAACAVLKESPISPTFPPPLPFPVSSHPKPAFSPIYFPKPPFRSPSCSLPLIGNAISRILFLRL